MLPFLKLLATADFVGMANSKTNNGFAFTFGENFLHAI